MTRLYTCRVGPAVTIAILVMGITGCAATSATEYLSRAPDRESATGEERSDTPAVSSEEQRAPSELLADGGGCLTYEDFLVFVNGEGAPNWTDCDQPNYAQLYMGADRDDPISDKLEHGFDYPGDEMATAIGEVECLATFEEWVGVPYQETTLELRFILYHPEFWPQRPRPAACFVVHPTSVLTHSVIGKGADYPLRNEDGEPEEPIEVASVKLRTDDCVLSTGGYGYETIVPCGQPHHEQVSAAFELPDGEFPGEDELHRIADDECLDRFAIYIGEHYDHSPYYTYAYAPAEEFWTVGDRSVQCRVYDPAGDIEGSLAGTGEGRTDTASAASAWLSGTG